MKRSIAARGAEFLDFARQQARKTKTWIDLHNAIFGIGGKFSELFPEQSERLACSKTDEFAKVQELIRDAQGNDPSKGLPDAPFSGKFVLRLPSSMHAALAAEAEAEGVSLNQLCLAKLALQLQEAVRPALAKSH